MDCGGAADASCPEAAESQNPSGLPSVGPSAANQTDRHHSAEPQRDKQAEGNGGQAGGPSSPSTEFRRRKRACDRERIEARHPINFVFENPFGGLFQQMDFVKGLIARHPHHVFLVDTSYCKYDSPYRKSTVFISTLPTFRPKSRCEVIHCKQLVMRGKHDSNVKAQTKAIKNSIPAGLVDLEVTAWKAMYPTEPAYKFLFIDVFTGYGSVAAHIRQAYPDVMVYTNDIVKRTGNNVELDLREFPCYFMMNLALLRFFGNPSLPEMPHGLHAWLRQERIAILFHLSTPCNTYSLDGIGTHRVTSTLTPKTKLAHDHDEMNAKLIEWFEKVCF